MAKDKDEARDEDDRDEADDRDDGEEETEGKASATDAADGDESPEDDSDEDEDGDEERAESDEDEERDASTAGVAKALGVDEDEPEEGEGNQEQAAAAPNRAARRREEVLKKRRARNEKKRDKDDEAAEEEEAEEAVAAREPLPKDKNLRAKELLKRRQEASKKAAAQVGLSAGEMVQDSLARAGSGAAKWFRTNFRAIAAVLVVGVAGTAGTMYYLDHREAKAGKTTDVLAKAVLTEQAPVIPDDKRPDEQKALDPMPVFPTPEAKSEAVLAAYTKVVDEHPGTGPGILGKLGQAGAYLDKGMADQAFSAYEDVLRSDLAKADVDVRARAMEGKGFALELKKDFDGAMNVFQSLEAVDKVYADLAKYHQARMHLAKGEKDKAKEILVALNKALEVPTLEGPTTPHLRLVIEETLRGIDPTLVRPKRAAGGPKGTPSPEELEKIRQQILEMQKKQAEEHGDGDGH